MNEVAPSTTEPVDTQSAVFIPQPSQKALPRFPLGLAQRLSLVGLLFAAEVIPMSNAIHKDLGAGALTQIAAVFFPLLFTIAYTKSRDRFRQVSAELKTLPLGWPLLAAHFAALFAFLLVSLGGRGKGFAVPGVLGAGLWYGTGLATVVLAVAAFLPRQAMLRLVRGTGFTWMYALAVAVAAQRLVVSGTLWNGAVWNPAIAFSWKPAIEFTFLTVRFLLRILLPNVVADRATMSIGTPHFHVEIAPWCAGFEGTALILVFSVAWLIFFRREYRFPQALLLVPAGMAVMWISNSLRITALILIGVAGAPNVAVNGFHSQAGWIAFTCVGLGFAVFSRRLAWCSRVAMASEPVALRTANPAAAYLMPFLVVLAAGMIATAASSGFEWLYPLRVIAAAIALWCFRAKYSEMNWRFGWVAALAGVAVFGLWLALDRFSGPAAENGIGAGLAALPISGRIAWLAFRTIGAVVTVPIGEELAFRGFLIRRLISADFDALSPRRYTYLALAVSSVAFGLLHGGRWIAGSVAGLIYAIAFLRRGRIGDAVFAHALTNALLAAWVLSGGRWYLW